MSKKGNAYDAKEVVVQARMRCGCPEGQFTSCSQKFGQTEAAFSDWVVVRSADVVRQKMKCPTARK